MIIIPYLEAYNNILFSFILYAKMPLVTSIYTVIPLCLEYQFTICHPRKEKEKENDSLRFWESETVVNLHLMCLGYIYFKWDKMNYTLESIYTCALKVISKYRDSDNFYRVHINGLGTIGGMKLSS